MTHSSHRFGTKEGLKKDFVVMAMASKGVNDVGSGPKIKEHLTICAEHNPVNLGGMKVGNLCNQTKEEIIAGAKDYVSTFNGVFCDRDTVRDVVKELIDKKVGLSTVISGVYTETKSIADELGFVPHTVNFPLGIWGKKELLPEPEILAITTQCGHGMISQHLVRYYMQRVADGFDAHKAAKEVCRYCYCAIANLDRVERILKEGAAKLNHEEVKESAV
ncbi:MAG: hypothetical protein J6P72_00835 [Firmicutes bacterium]|nr:hypothetical protein [Bacillota bacterium]